MTTETLQTPEAKEIDAEEATPEPSDSDTPAPDSTVHGDEEVDSEPEFDPELDELKYSERTLTAAREVALAEARDTFIRERDTARDAAVTRLTAMVKDSGADPATVIRNVMDELKVLGPDLTPEDMEPTLKAVRDARALIEEAALDLAAETWREVITASFPDEATAKSFWEEVRGINPALPDSGVLKLYTEHHALTTRAIATADPEVLLKANAKLRADKASHGDARFRAGRLQGRKDPPGDASSEGRPAKGEYTYAELTKMNKTQLDALPEGTFERVLSGAK